MPGYRPAPDIVVTVRQSGRTISDRTCDFPAEINCIGAVRPNHPAKISTTGRVTFDQPAIYLSWR